MKIYPHLSKFATLLLSIFFPQQCLVCGTTGPKLCFTCLAREIDYFEEGDIVALWNYKNPHIQKALWILKYSGGRTVGKVFGNFLYETILDHISEERVFEGTIHTHKKTILIPIPLTRRRLRERGYNQSEEICQGILEMDPNNLFEYQNELLIKVRETIPQTKMKSRKDRLQNLKKTFILQTKRKNILSGKTVIVIDDVTTTGATFREAKRILLHAGAKKVFCLAVAH